MNSLLDDLCVGRCCMLGLAPIMRQDVSTCPMNHEQSTSLMVITRTESTHGLAYSLARVIKMTAWQSIDAVCHCCLTHGSHVEITGLVSSGYPDGVSTYHNR